MTISSTARKAGPFSGTGAQTIFPFAFKVFTASDLLVVRTGADGVETPLLLTADYTVGLNSNQDSAPGGQVTMRSAPPAGTLLTIGSAVPATQGQSIPNMGGFYPKVIEQALDKLTIVAQQTADAVRRSLRFPFSDADGVNGALPVAGVRAGKFLVFDSAGNPTVTSGTGTDAALRGDIAAPTGARLMGIDLTAIAGAVGSIDWAIKTAGGFQLNVLRYIPPAQWAAMFAGTSTYDATAYIQAALNACVGASLYFPPIKCRTTSPLIVRRGVSVNGDAGAQIIADFSSDVWAGDYVAVKFLVDSGNSQPEIFASFGQTFQGMKITGSNNADKISYGLKFYTSVQIPVASAVNFSYLHGLISNVVVERFDTALQLLECWNSEFFKVTVKECRVGISIAGKSVNLQFLGCTITNTSSAYTSSTAKAIGFSCASGFQYAAGAEGRPEGITFANGLIYGFFNDIAIVNGLQVLISDSIIDGAYGDCISVNSCDGFVATGNYIYAAGSFAGIIFNGVGAASSADTEISSNKIVGDGSAASYGVHFPAVGLPRQGINISNNSFFNHFASLNLVNCPVNSQITGNYAEFVSGPRMIYVQNGGDQTVIDANTTSADVYPLATHPAATYASLVIGSNTAASGRTSYSGKATLLAGTTSISLPNYFRSGGENYVRAITTASPEGNVGASWITNEVNNGSATFNVAAAPVANVTIRYTVKAVPYSAY